MKKNLDRNTSQNADVLLVGKRQAMKRPRILHSTQKLFFAPISMVWLLHSLSGRGETKEKEKENELDSPVCA